MQFLQFVQFLRFLPRARRVAAPLSRQGLGLRASRERPGAGAWARASQGLIFGDAGVAAVDAMCQAEASAAALPGTYLAWLSTSTVNAKDRLGSDGPWFNTRGQRIARSLDDLTDGVLENPITYDAAGGGPPSPPYNLWPYTGTQADGTAAAGMTCGDWTVTTGGVGLTGYADRTSDQWTNFNDRGCDGQLNADETGYVGRAVYCFQVP